MSFEMPYSSAVPSKNAVSAKIIHSIDTSIKRKVSGQSTIHD